LTFGILGIYVQDAAAIFGKNSCTEKITKHSKKISDFVEIKGSKR
jgi:hypothetical protein